jgi:hypothetical protein
MHDDGNDNIFDKDDVLDFLVYMEFEKQDRGKNGGKGGCFGIVVQLLLPVANAIFLNWQ